MGVDCVAFCQRRRTFFERTNIYFSWTGWRSVCGNGQNENLGPYGGRRRWQTRRREKKKVSWCHSINADTFPSLWKFSTAKNYVAWCRNLKCLKYYKKSSKKTYIICTEQQHQKATSSTCSAEARKGPFVGTLMYFSSEGALFLMARGNKTILQFASRTRTSSSSSLFLPVFLVLATSFPSSQNFEKSRKNLPLLFALGLTLNCFLCGKTWLSLLL